MVKTMEASNTATMSTGQIEDLVNKIRDALRKRASTIPHALAQQVCSEKNIGVLCADPFFQRVEAGLALVSRGSATITLDADHNPDQFYRTRSGLYVWDDYRERVVSKAKLSPAGASYKFNYSTLARDLRDREIEACLPAQHLFDETAVCAIIAGLITKQPQGEEQVLLNNGCANLFYLAGCVVIVYWVACDREWGVDTYAHDDDGWDAGSQVFFPATGA